MASARESGAVSVTIPTGRAAPVVFDSPHSGFEFPADFQPVATRAEIRTTWDAYVDELCADVTEAGATLVTARFPRAYVDPNRAENDIDPEVLATPWPQPVELSEYGRRGMGLIRRIAGSAVPMYDRLLTVAEVQTRIASCHAPYRGALSDAIEARWRQHGVVWHFNMHSMKSRGSGRNGGPDVVRPDVVVGDRNGTTAPAALTEWVAAFFLQRGFRTTVNDPHRGADIVRTHGDPARQRYSVQIEINRALYLDESSGARNAGFGEIRRHLAQFAMAVRELTRAGA